MNYSVFIEKSLESTSDIARNSFGKVSWTTKTWDNNQVLTETDVMIWNFLIEKIQDEFPNHNIIDEEIWVIDKWSDYTWVIDPIDWTSNFASWIPTYWIMIGLMHKFLPIAWGIALPSFNEIIIAQKWLWTRCNWEKLLMSHDKNLINSLVAYWIDWHQENPELTYKECKLLSEIVLSIRNLRSSNSVFDTVMVAKWNYWAFLNRTCKIRDNVAQQIVIEEAWWVYTDFFWKEIDYSDWLNDPEKNYTYMTGTQTTHQELLEIVNKHSIN